MTHYSRTAAQIPVSPSAGYCAQHHLDRGICYLAIRSILMELQVADLDHSMADYSTTPGGILILFPGG